MTPWRSLTGDSGSRRFGAICSDSIEGDRSGFGVREVDGELRSITLREARPARKARLSQVSTRTV